MGLTGEAWRGVKPVKPGGRNPRPGAGQRYQPRVLRGLRRGAQIVSKPLGVLCLMVPV